MKMPLRNDLLYVCIEIKQFKAVSYIYMRCKFSVLSLIFFQIKGEVSRSLNVTIATNYGLPNNMKKTKAIDTLQITVSYH